ncbi:MAG TPA: DUF2079 domain-containing protein [Candidatus Baltobacteraceae bacterium]|nr:DUF2079 domain-containing protein [Candidatus Baltobacteraceae bacterium]
MRHPARGIVIAALVFAAIYVALDLNKLYALRYGADTGTFLQFLTNEAHGRGSWNYAEMRPHLQVHDSWMLLVFVPLMAIAPYAQTLLVLQVLAIAAGGVALFALARSFGASDRAATIVGIAYLISPSAQGIAYGNFLENVFVPVVAFAGVYFARRRSLAGTLACAQMLLGLKEDQALFLTWFGVACAVWWDRRIGIAVTSLAVVNGLAFVAYERLAHVAPSIPSYSLHVDDPVAKSLFFIAILAPFAFAPLRMGWRLLLALPLVAELTFNGPWAYPIARIGTHWTASLFAACAIAAAYVVARVPRFATPMLVCAIICGLFFNDTVLKIGRWPYVVDWQAYRSAVTLRDGSTGTLIPRHEEGIYAVAAANPAVRLSPYKGPEAGYCPAYDTNAAAFFASLRIRSLPQRVTLCEGVPVKR